MRRLKIAARIAWRHRRWSRDQRVDRAFGGGLAMIAVGFGFVYPPLFLIVGGGMLAGLAWKYGKATTPSARSEPDVDDDGDREDN